MAEELARIYQGRVVKVEVKDASGKWIDTGASCSERLLEHHSLFQDAVNYYLLALAAMSNNPRSLVGKMKQQIKDSAWVDSKNGKIRSGMPHSIERSLAMPEGSLCVPNGFEIALRRVLDDNKENPETLQKAVMLLMNRCDGESKIRDSAPQYLPRFVNTEDEEICYDYDNLAEDRHIGRQFLLAKIFSSEKIETFNALEIIELASQLRMRNLVNVSEKKITKDELFLKISEAAKYFLTDPNIPTSLKNLLDAHSEIKDFLLYVKDNAPLTTLSYIETGKGGPGACDRNCAAILFLAFPNIHSLQILKTIFNEKYLIKKEKEYSSCIEFQIDETDIKDPIKKARGTRGYVFKAFTELPIWQEKISWNAFDKEAFKEALKTLNQFWQKGEERKKKLADVRSQLAWMEGPGQKTKNNNDTAEDGDSAETLPPVLAGDPRWDALKNIQKDIGFENDFTDGEQIEYGLAKRTVRGFKEIREQWQKVLTKGSPENTSSIEDIYHQMVDILHQYQTENKYAMGSADLFHKLAEPQYWMIWRKDYNTENGDQSDDIISDAVRYFELKEDEIHLKEPIRFTPADARYSRRLCDLTAISGGKTKNFGQNTDLSLTAKIAYRENKNEKWTLREARISYTAPRFLRDGLKNVANQQAGSIYLPPLAAGLEQTPMKINFLKVDSQLMPDWDRNGKLRVLLNFPVRIDAKAYHQKEGIRFQKQFFGAKDKNIFLHWSDTNKEANWFMSGKPFDFLAVDLGQRTAGAATILNVSPEKLNEKYSRSIGYDGMREWYALRKYATLLRLPGEDCKCWNKGVLKEELWGSKGRNSSPGEQKEAIELCCNLGEKEELLHDVDSFPEQNDKLLIAVRRAIGRLRKLNRWIRFWKSDDSLRQKAITEMEGSDFIASPFSLEGLLKQENSLRAEMPGMMLKITSRILPLRGRHWCWTTNPDSVSSFLLRQSEKGTAPGKVWIRGQRGLSFARLEQLEELRKNWLSLNRLLMLPVGEKPPTPKEMRKDPVPDPCPDILNRLEEMKEQRVNQTAHLILALALGVRLKKHTSSSAERNASSIHGEYEKIPGRSPVSFIVIEDLSRYLSAQGRAPSENTKLMKWMHRAVRDKIIELCKPFGISVLEVNAAYSSRFSSVSCVPGFRAEEITLQDRDSYYWKKLRNKKSEGKETPEAKACNELFEKMENFSKEYPDIKTFSLLAPKAGGEIFVPVDWNNDPLIQADINAAVNIGLRGVASPLKYEVFPKMKAERTEDGNWLAKGTSKRDEIRFGKKGRKIKLQISQTGNVCPEKKHSSSKKKEIENFFLDIAHISNFEQAYFEDDENIHLASGKALWKAVNDKQWNICLKIADYRIDKMKKHIKS